MIKPYEEFSNILRKRVGNFGDDFIYNLLINIINNPTRYTGVFRLTNAKTKIIQNVTQSQEIKFGDFMEEIITQYIEHMGYTNLLKNIGNDEDGFPLSADQVFQRDDVIYLIEQKIRDDHDSTKKRGQFLNFKKKVNCLKEKYPGKQIIAVMWFVDESLVKNRRYYQEQMLNDMPKDVVAEIKYGSALFIEVFNRPEVWEEIYAYLLRNKIERSQDVLQIPDFDTSNEIYAALCKLKANEPRLYKKLMSYDNRYRELRSELFPTGKNLR